MTKLIITLIAVYVFTLAYIYLLKIVFKFKGVKRIAYVPILNTLVCVVFPLYSVLNFISKKIN